MGSRRRTKMAGLSGVLVGVTIGAVGCGGTSSVAVEPRAARGPVDIVATPEVPTDFAKKIDNPYLPMDPGTTLTYWGRGEGGSEKMVVTVTHRTRQVAGVTTRVVRDRVWRRGSLVEDTLGWFAQDRSGNVWCFGEDTRQLDNGDLGSTAESWEAGQGGAKAAVVMMAEPAVGSAYRHESYQGAETAEVLGVSGRLDITVGAFDRVVKTRDISTLQLGVAEHRQYRPGVGFVLEQTVTKGRGGAVEHKYYAPGVGLVLEQQVSNSWGGLQLVDIAHR